MVNPKEGKVLQIQQAKDIDIPDLICLEDKCFSTYYKKHRFNKAEFANYLRRKRAILLVARLSSLLVGYAAGSLKSTRFQLSVSLDSIAVLPMSQGKGIGDQLMQCFIKEAKRRGCKKITLVVAVANKNGIMFFSNRGFQNIRLLPAYYGKGLDGILMKLEF